MRTSPVALAHLGNTDAIAHAARAISDLTHADPAAGDACVLWFLAIDHAIRTGKLDVRVGLDRVDPPWAALLDEAEAHDPEHFADSNGWVVSALQAAWSAAHKAGSHEAGVQAAVRGGGDTVAAIAGGLLGAAHGASSIGHTHRRAIHGWPGLRARDLIWLAVSTTLTGGTHPDGWPTAPRVTSYQDSSHEAVPHPDDPGVLLGAVGALRAGVADAVVSLCRLGRDQAPVTPDARDHIEVWLVDGQDANLDAPAVIADAARAVQTLRSEGRPSSCTASTPRPGPRSSPPPTARSSPTATRAPPCDESNPPSPPAGTLGPPSSWPSSRPSWQAGANDAPARTASCCPHREPCPVPRGLPRRRLLAQPDRVRRRPGSQQTDRPRAAWQQDRDRRPPSAATTPTLRRRGRPTRLRATSSEAQVVRSAAGPGQQTVDVGSAVAKTDRRESLRWWRRERTDVRRRRERRHRRTLEQALRGQDPARATQRLRGTEGRNTW
jgi:hypothetical protein